MGGEIISLLLLTILSLALIGSGLRNRPGIGIILALLFIAVLAWSRRGGLGQFGFGQQQSWAGIVAIALLIGSAIALLALAVIEPAAEAITGQPHDVSIVEDVRGDAVSLIRWLVVIWLLVAPLEELIFRGFMMTELVRLLGIGPWSLAATLALSSLVFGLAHTYQGPSGAISATVLGLLIGVLFIASSFNLWLAILIHGVIDTVQLILMSLNMDRRIRQTIFSP